jgi:hypothetical protein
MIMLIHFLNFEDTKPASTFVAAGVAFAMSFQRVFTSRMWVLQSSRREMATIRELRRLYSLPIMLSIRNFPSPFQPFGSALCNAAHQVSCCR